MEPWRLLDPDPDGRLPGGDVARLQLHRTLTTADGRHEWGLYARTCYLDDGLGEVLAILELVAPHVSEVSGSYGGFIRETLNEDKPSVITFTGGTYAIGC
ncbi:hypothetical protein AB0B66_20715 [Catellatospora sp. NPDC049111]|uniref:hypothetical protein n=1 Tax=Catellatospora sp. NPDC049111 TaxID=3155271 RepID=UPI0033DF333F